MSNSKDLAMIESLEYAYHLDRLSSGQYALTKTQIIVELKRLMDERSADQELVSKLTSIANRIQRL